MSSVFSLPGPTINSVVRKARAIVFFVAFRFLGLFDSCFLEQSLSQAAVLYRAAHMDFSGNAFACNFALAVCPDKPPFGDTADALQYYRYMLG